MGDEYVQKKKRTDFMVAAAATVLCQSKRKLWVRFDGHSYYWGVCGGTNE